MKHVLIVLAACAALTLTACGGGGGGGRSPMTPMMPTTPVEPTTPTPVGPAEAFEGAVDRTEGAPAIPTDAIGTLIQSGPQFGSVVQNFYTPGLAPVRDVSTSFNGDRFTVNVTRQNGSAFSLDTDRDEVYDVSAYSPTENSIANRPVVEGYVVGESGGTYTAAGAFIEWDNTDFTNYLAAGYWLHVDTNTNAAEMGAFIDGTDFDMAASIPSLGTATYTGRTGGVYLAQGGSDADVMGATEEGEYASDLSLTANFQNMTIGGQADNVVLYNVNVFLPNGTELFYPEAEATTYQVNYGDAPIGSTGGFTGNDITVTSQDYNLDTTTGTWGGQFSGVNDSNGDPRAVAGTNAVYFNTTGGSEAVFTGAFYGATGQFE